MRTAWLTIISLLFCGLCSRGEDPTADARKRMSERSNTGNLGGIVSPSAKRNQTVVTYITYLSREREWSDSRGRKMTGRLVAFSAPEPGKTGEVVVIRDGKVRLRRTGVNANSDFPLDQLSQPDQIYVKAIEAGIRGAAAEKKAANPE